MPNYRTKVLKRNKKKESITFLMEQINETKQNRLDNIFQDLLEKHNDKEKNQF
jgi:uncharacterized iron-regulated protein